GKKQTKRPRFQSRALTITSKSAQLCSRLLLRLWLFFRLLIVARLLIFLLWKYLFELWVVLVEAREDLSHPLGLFVGKLFGLRAVIHNVRDQEDHELGLGAVGAGAAEEVADEGQVSQDRDLVFVYSLAFSHQASEHHN